MIAYTVRRIALAVPILLASTFIVFVLVSVSSDPLERLRLANPPPRPEALAAEAGRLHLDQGLLERYWTWLTGLFRGEFGPSVNVGTEIGGEIAARFMTTLRLIVAAMIVAVLLAIVAGVISAVRQYSRTDYTITFFGFLFLATPSFWLAILLKEGGITINSLFGAQWLFTIGDRSPYLPDPSFLATLNDIVGHLLLPTVSLALISFAAWSRFQRASMLEVLNSDYVRLARAKGLRWRKVLTHHALRTALIPLTTVTALDVSALIGGAVITETVFQWRGMGDFLLRSIREADHFAVMAWLLVAATFVILFNLAADLLYAVLDPRIRYD